MANALPGQSQAAIPPEPGETAASRTRSVLVSHEICLDAANQRLKRGAAEIALRPKTFAVLRYLMEHPGRLVTKTEILEALWPDTSVSPAVLKVCISEIRQALGDEIETPRFIRTASRLGYWYIAPVEAPEDAGQAGQAPASVLEEPPAQAEAEELVGRKEELSLLWGHLEEAIEGARQIVFVTGEAGIGKTSLLGAFLDLLRAGSGVRVAVGQCIEHRAAGEAYLPVLDALGELCRRPDGAGIRAPLRRYAPTWLLHLPALIDPADQDQLRRETIGTTAERMLREMAEALEAITAETPLVLVLEDLHWGDPATLDLISYLARRRPRARLLLLCLYRPEDSQQQGHQVSGLLRDLLFQRRCVELQLRGFSDEEVEQYLTGRLAARRPPAELAAAIRRRTGGNPLFVANVVEVLAAGSLQGPDEVAADPGSWLEEVERIVPESLRLILEHRLSRLGPEEQRVLEGASVLGEEFTAEGAAAALLLSPETVEEVCERLAQRRLFVGTHGLSEWPDGSVSGRYRFLHALYRSFLSGRVAPARQVQYHHRAGTRLERAYGDRADELAAELARHFELGHAHSRAVHYLRRAARSHARRYANREAVAALTHALELLPLLQQQERLRLEPELREQRGLVYRSMGDLPAALAEFTAVAGSAGEAGDGARRIKALLYMADDLAWFDTARCVEVLEQAVALSRDAADEGVRVQARGYLGYVRATRLRWSDEDADACVAAARSAQGAGEDTLAWYGRASHILNFRSQYRAGGALAQEGLERALRVGDIAEYLNLMFSWAGSLFGQGALGPSIDLEAAAVETAQKNGHHMWAAVFRKCIALSCLQACSFAEARELAEEGLAFAEQDPDGRKTVVQMCHSLLGFAYVGLGEPAKALRYLEMLPAESYQNLNMGCTVLYALSECLLALGETARAAEEAGRLIEWMTPPGERALISLGRRARARAAMAEGRWEQAQEEICLALALVEQGDPLVSEWRVQATAAEIHRHYRREEEARRCFARSAALVRGIADGLRGHPTTLQAFLSYPEVSSILTEDAAGTSAAP